MNKWTKTAGLIFLATASVYSDRVIAANPAKSATAKPTNVNKAPQTDVKLLEETDPFAVAPTAAPTTVPSSASAASGAAENKAAPVAPVQLNPDGTFSLNITAGADVVEQLRVIGFQAQSSIIPSKEVHGSLPAMDLYNVTVHEALDALLHANGFAWREKGKFIYVYSAKEVAEQEKAARVTSTEVFRLYYTPAANAMTMIKPVLSSDAQVAVTTPAKAGIATGTTDVGGNDHGAEDLLVVTDYPENLDKARQVLKEVDRRPQQIIIEATILRASLSEDNAFGVDFNIVGGVDFASVTQGIAGIAPAFGAGSTAYSGNNAHSAGTGNSFTNQINNGLKVGVVTNNVSAFVSALEGVTDTAILANPKVLALNKQKGEVIVGREDGYITTTTTETSSTQTVEFLKTGTRLIFRPYIGDDGYIRMELHPEDSSGGLQTAANLPFKITTEVTSNVMIKDGHTIVIGGLFRESNDTTRSQIPVLGNLPLAGPLFRQQRDTTRREEVIILITPHIVKSDEAMNELSEAALKDAEKLRVGVRKGMMFWGRERLAQMHYEKALAEMNKSKPNRGMAIWHLNSATNLNPKFLEAIKMKQDLTGKELATSDSSSIRTFVRRSMLVDKAPATQPVTMVDDAWAPAEDPLALQAPTSAPSAATAMAPATQPSANEAIVEAAPATKVFEVMAPSTAPATHPAIVELSTESDDVVASSNKSADAKEGRMTVTELPSEEATASSDVGDLNK